MKLKTLIAASAFALLCFSSFAASSAFVSGVANFVTDVTSASDSSRKTVKFKELAGGIHNNSGDLSANKAKFSRVSFNGNSQELYSGSKSRLTQTDLEATASEPETYSMVLLGLCLMVAVARRRNK